MRAYEERLQEINNEISPTLHAAGIQLRAAQPTENQASRTPAFQLKAPTTGLEGDSVIQKKGGKTDPPTVLSAIQRPNQTGLPNNLKAGIENLSGLSMDDVKVHYNSSKPAQLNALAYTQGTDIHVAPGQERHLPHECWHVVQQKQGRVKPTMQKKGKLNMKINNDVELEKEADAMGKKALKISGKRNIELEKDQNGDSSRSMPDKGDQTTQFYKLMSMYGHWSEEDEAEHRVMGQKLYNYAKKRRNGDEGNYCVAALAFSVGGGIGYVTGRSNYQENLHAEQDVINQAMSVGANTKYNFIAMFVEYPPCVMPRREETIEETESVKETWQPSPCSQMLDQYFLEGMPVFYLGHGKKALV